VPVGGASYERAGRGGEPRACQRGGAVNHRESGTSASGASTPASMASALATGTPASVTSAPAKGMLSRGERATREDAVPCWKRRLSPPDAAVLPQRLSACPRQGAGLTRAVVVFPPRVAVASSSCLAHAALSPSRAMAVSRRARSPSSARRFGSWNLCLILVIYELVS